MQRTLLKIGWVLIFISLGFAAPAAQAGGWAAVTLDTLPVEARAGEEIRIGFTVRQHGLRAHFLNVILRSEATKNLRQQA